MGRAKWRQKALGINAKSGLEAEFIRQATKKKLPFKYEEASFPYIIKFAYTPDFQIDDEGKVFVETKGHFDSADRRKMKAFKEQYPDIEVYLLFGNSENKISKKSKTTYAKWAEKHGFKWADIRNGFPSKWWDKSKDFKTPLTKEAKKWLENTSSYLIPKSDRATT